VKSCRSILGIFALSAALSLASTVEGKTIRISGLLTVERGSVLAVGPGDLLIVEGKILVKGVLRIKGEKGKPAVLRLLGGAPYGIEVRGGKVVGSEFEIEGGKGGVSVYGGSVELESGRMRVDRVALNFGGDSLVKLKSLLFSGGKAGVIVRGASRTEIVGSTFEKLSKGGVYVQEEGNLKLIDCEFIKNSVGMRISMSGVKCEVRGTAFVGNGTGILVERLASPRVFDSRFLGNEVGVKFTRRGRGNFESNVFDGNSISVFVEYSSYPRFRHNDFLSFREAAVFVEKQSSLWEKRATDADREGLPYGRRARGGEKRSRKVDGLPKAELTGKLDFRENFWDGLTSELKSGRENVSGIRDGRDDPFFEYKGVEYPLDVVDFSGFSEKPFKKGKRSD